VNWKKSKFAVAILLGGTIASWSPSYAGNEAMMELLKVLRDNGTIDAQTYELLRQSATVEEEQKTEAVQKQIEEATKDSVKVTTKGKLQFEDPNGDWQWRIGGRIMVDAAAYDEDQVDLGSGAEIRRARLYMSGKWLKAWAFKLQYEFANTDDPIDGIRDAYIQYLGFKPTNLTIGNYKEPFSLEELTSSKYITFMERALPNALVPGRALGFGFHTYGDKWTLATGIFGEGVDTDVETDDGREGSSGLGLTGRVTFSPIHEDARAIHLGLSLSSRSTNDVEKVRFRARPESHVTNTRLIDTGTLDADTISRIGVAAAGTWGPFSLQGEYLAAEVERAIAGKSDVDFDGFYIQGSYFLTGESRPYNFKKGVFDGIKPKSVVGKGGRGAWEIAARFSNLNLSDGDINGGEQDDFTLGLNWYPTRNLRFMANYIKVLDVDGGDFNGDEPSVFQVRAQAAW